MIVIDQQARILLGHRIKHGETPTWCLPGGHVELGETFEEAGLREVAEETGINDLGKIDARVVMVHSSESTLSVTIGLIAAKKHFIGDVRITEPEVFSKWEWFPSASLPSPLFPASKALLSYIYNGITPDGWMAYRMGADMEGFG